MNIRIILSFLLCLLCHGAPLRAQIFGTVTDKATGEPLGYVNVRFEGEEEEGTVRTGIEGRYSIEYKEGKTKLIFSTLGYADKEVRVSALTGELNVEMEQEDRVLKEVLVNPKKEKYSRKNNPAVELMKKVVEAKKLTDLAENDYYHYNKYQKLTFALNNITDDSLKKSKIFSKYPFFREQVEYCPETQKNILPVSVDETVTEEVYRKSPQSRKTIVKGMKSSGVNELFNTGDILTTVLQDVFQDVNIYDDRVQLFQYPFDSPVSKNGIAFYRYYITDTTYVDQDRCIHLTFAPNNSQDFGFSGHLYILDDSTYRVKQSTLFLPKKSNVNFVDNLIIDQRFGELPEGGWALKDDDMLCELSLYKAFGHAMVRRTTRMSNYSFEPLPNQVFKKKGTEIKEVNAMMRDDDFWKEYRGDEELTRSESRMDRFVKDLSRIKGFKYIMFVAKALIENFVETGPKGKPSKVDIGPVNTIVSSNYIDGLRLRASAQTTANLHPHLFLKGYYAYGFKDDRSKYMGEVEYSFNKKEYLPREYPKNSLTFTYQYDNMSPSDKFMRTDKDNMFNALKVTTVDQYNYERKATLKYELEVEGGWKTTLMMRHSNYEPCGKLFYRTLGAEEALQVARAAGTVEGNSFVRSDYNLHDFTLAEVGVDLRYAPGETFINTKQRRLPINLDAPVFTLSHTVGIRGVLGSDYTYNLTEAGIYKRFWFGSSWGNLDIYLKGGVQWNKVPFPLLIMPAANLSYIIQDENFNLINNMEFLNDRYASLDMAWNLQGKIFNRIPLLRRLKWREYFGVKCLWGTLTDKNNPFLEENRGDGRLMMFPGHYDGDGNYRYSSFVMDRKKPYVEGIVGIHNIFKLVHVEYVHRFTDLDLPTSSRWGIRFMIRTVF